MAGSCRDRIHACLLRASHPATHPAFLGISLPTPLHATPLFHSCASAPHSQAEEVQQFLVAARDTLGQDLRKPAKRPRRERHADRAEDADDGFESEGLVDDSGAASGVHGGRPQRLVPSFMEPYAARRTALAVHRPEPQFRVVHGEPVTCWNEGDGAVPTAYSFAWSALRGRAWARKRVAGRRGRRRR